MDNIVKEFFEAVDPSGLNGAEAEVTPQGIMVNDTLVGGKKNYKPFNQAQNVSTNALRAIKKAYNAIPDKSAVAVADTSVPDIQVKANGEAVINPEKGQSYRVKVSESEEEFFKSVLDHPANPPSVRTGVQKSRMIGGNPRGETNLEDVYDLDPKTGVWTSKDANKFGARTSFGESEDHDLVKDFFEESNQ